jgi:16S rRNA (guanine527-N7)-methyltransferase
MRPERIAELLRPYLPLGESLSPDDLTNISTYIDILQRWNARINLTAIRDPEEMVTRHFGESLFAAQHLFPKNENHNDFRQNEEHNGFRREGGRAALQGRVTGRDKMGALAPVEVADVGSGAGFPGLPVKLWAPHISLTLIESNHKKATFLREVARALILTDINIIAARAETLDPASFDVVILRAVERFEAVLPVAAALVRPSGRLALLIGSAQLAQARSLLPHHEFSDPFPIPLSTSRVLAVVRARAGNREPN